LWWLTKRLEGGLLMTTTIRDVMTEDVVTVTENAPFKEVAGLLAAYRVGALPVLDAGGHVVGLISETDLLLKQELPHAAESAPLFEGRQRRDQRFRAAGRLARTIMSAPAITVSPDTAVARAARLMHASKVKHLPVVDDDGRLVGIVSRGDLLRVFLRADEDILAEILRLVADQPYADPGRVTVGVTDGVVKLAGTVGRRSAARTLTLLAQELDGVVAVDERLGFEVDDLYVPYTTW
jgi:CBS domain-containing protein